MPTKGPQPEAGFSTQQALRQVCGRTLASALPRRHSRAGIESLVLLPARAPRQSFMERLYQAPACLGNTGPGLDAVTQAPRRPS